MDKRIKSVILLLFIAEVICFTQYNVNSGNYPRGSFSCNNPDPEYCDIRLF